MAKLLDVYCSVSLARDENVLAWRDAGKCQFFDLLQKIF
ncbi:hypothetical protein HKBW3S44_00590 [Candidatus Hakubella thermalkaliphila]|uniref:Uncharacterized protein n=1 Tax=Candidatus Hakubella thermalkaliphila TaxID=2754717 RepID=A0A6V8PF70_9ACTN|nr:hypothetical protein HKBW3S34_01235 [Candidatus Hakubella thermalkaliphila]GFP36909.1 hypothetical protein HKBW3S44_00590 [Candidatus Hakubella thermalkaliphila]